MMLKPKIAAVSVRKIFDPNVIGTTPSNIASSIEHKNIKIVAGLNLSMILNVFNYPGETLDQLSKKAIEGGAEGVAVV